MRSVYLLLISFAFTSTLMFSCSSPIRSQGEITTTPISPEITSTPNQEEIALSPTLTSLPTTPTPEKPITPRFAWFYKPPQNAELSSLVDAYDLFILTRMDENERDIIKAYSAGAPLLQYILFSEIQDPGSCSKQPFHNQVADEIGDYCLILSQHPGWFLRASGGEIAANDDGYQMMDPGNQEWREYWLSRIKASQDIFGWRGVFLDNVEGSLEKRSRYNGTLLNYTTDEQYQDAIEDNLKFIDTAYFREENIPLFANIISLENPETWFRYLNYLDGAMLENFAVDWNDTYLSAERWEMQLDLAEKTQALGKEIILVSQGNALDNQRQTFSYASYLLVNHGRAYFRYTHASEYEYHWPSEYYEMDLGNPIGSRYKDGTNWMRNFERGVVRVNPQSHVAVIEVNP